MGALATVSASVAQLTFADPTGESASTVVCRAYRDPEGQMPGSALFSQECVARITTQAGGNEIGSIYCEEFVGPN